MSHDPPREIISLSGRSDETTFTELQLLAAERLGEETELEFGHDIIEKFVCPYCTSENDVFSPMGNTRHSQAICPICDKERGAKTFYKVCSDASFMDKTLAQIGVPKFDIVWARNQSTCIGFEFFGDAPDVLGCLHQPQQE